MNTKEISIKTPFNQSNRGCEKRIWDGKHWRKEGVTFLPPQQQIALALAKARTVLGLS